MAGGRGRLLVYHEDEEYAAPTLQARGKLIKVSQW